MLRRFLDLPLVVILMGIGAVFMYFPAAHAAATRDHEVMRIFFYSGTLFLLLTAFIGIAMANREVTSQSRSHLLAMLAALTILPMMLAVPFMMAAGSASFLDAYFEMVSSVTTTGATLYSDPGSIPPSAHLWRAMVGWLGGFFMLVTAVAILAPMNLGGFEVMSSASTGQAGARDSDSVWATDGSVLLQRFTLRLFPVYAGLTTFLWIMLLILGETPLTALCHSMSVLATSGISPVGGIAGGQAGIGGEVLVFLLLIPAISRQSIVRDRRDVSGGMKSDPEFRLGLLLVIVAPLFLFFRHWFGAYEAEMQTDLIAGLSALWGGTFTVLSFLTTTGFESASWEAARDWSGLPTPGLVLMGLGLVGGGVATTAGGVKLLRVYALYKASIRELERLVHPSSLGGDGSVARRLRREGAYVAWIFFMLFALSLSLIALLLAATGLDFETATVLAIAGLSTTGPMVNIADIPISYEMLGAPGKLILMAAMVLGRLETLAIIAMFNPDFWRR